MEDTLGDQLTGGLHYEERVLILIIMEDAFGAEEYWKDRVVAP